MTLPTYSSLITMPNIYSIEYIYCCDRGTHCDKFTLKMLCGPFMVRFSLDNPFYGPMVSNFSFNTILHGPLMPKFSLGNW